MERWRPVVGFEDTHSVSDFGRVRVNRPRYSTNEGGVLRQSWRGRYLFVTIWNNGIHYGTPVHQLVAAAFLGECPFDHCVNHKSGDRSDNSEANLEYVTPAENNRHARDTGLNKAFGETHPNAILTDCQVAAVRAAYVPHKVTAKILANRFGVSVGNVEDILYGRRRQVPSGAE